MNEVSRRVLDAHQQDPASVVAVQALHRVPDATVYVVGGAVRDAALGLEPNDIDLMVRGLPHELVDTLLDTLSGHHDYRGKSFGVFRYRHDGSQVDIALPRREISSGPRHVDFNVQEDPWMSIDEDLSRRDFTVNAMAVNLRTGDLIDPYGGFHDARARLLKAIGDMSMIDDPLRTVRALVLIARFGLYPDPRTETRMRVAGELIQNLPGERIYWELDKMFSAPYPDDAILTARDLDLLQYILPDVASCMGYDQRNPHHELDLGEHLLKVFARTCDLTEDPDTRIAALLHDIGKPGSVWYDPITGNAHYYEYHSSDPKWGILGADHAAVGAELSYQFLKDQGWPAARALKISSLVGHHMFAEFTTLAGARRFVSKQSDHAEKLLVIRRADQAGKVEQQSVDRMDELVAQVRASEGALSRADLAVGGRDILGLSETQGRIIGQTLDHLLEMVLEDPRMNERPILMGLAQAFLSTQQKE